MFVVGVCRGLADLTHLRLISANGADVVSTATPAAASKKTSIGPIIGGTYTSKSASILCYAWKMPFALFIPVRRFYCSASFCTPTPLGVRH